MIKYNYPKNSLFTGQEPILFKNNDEAKKFLDNLYNKHYNYLSDYCNKIKNKGSKYRYDNDTVLSYSYEFVVNFINKHTIINSAVIYNQLIYEIYANYTLHQKKITMQNKRKEQLFCEYDYTLDDYNNLTLDENNIYLIIEEFEIELFKRLTRIQKIIYNFIYVEKLKRIDICRLLNETATVKFNITDITKIKKEITQVCLELRENLLEK